MKKAIFKSCQLFSGLVIYKRSFPPVTSTFSISTEKIGKMEGLESISYDFAKFIPEMENTEFGREVSHDYFYVARVAESSFYTALIYSSVNFYGEEMQPIHTTLVTYSSNGEIISRKMVSCQCSAEKIKTVDIDGNNILIKDYKRIWDKPIDKVSFEKNSVKELHLLATAEYEIDESGVITEVSVPSNYNDSTTIAIR